MENFVSSDNAKFVLGKNGKSGSIDFGKIKSGIKKEEITNGDENLKSVFNFLDENGDGILSRSELQNVSNIFVQADKNKDGIISEHEAKNIQGKDNKKLGRKSGQALLQLLNNIMQKAVESGVKNVTTDDNNDEVVTYEDGTVEINHTDGSKNITFEEDGSQITQEVDKNGKLTKETETDSEGKTTVTEYDEDGNRKQQKITTKDGKEYEIQYKNNQPETFVITDKTNNTVTKGHYEGDSLVKDEVTNNETGSTTIYEGNKTTIRQNEDNKTTTSVYIDENLKSEKITENLDNGSEKVTYTQYSEEDTQTTITVDGKKQQIIKNGYSVNYDEDGYITGVIVQNGEDLRTIANKFGCTVEELLKANKDVIKGKSPNYYFIVGQEIRVPDMDIDSFIEVNSTRKSAEETTSDYNTLVEKQKAEEEAKLQEQKAADDAKEAEETKRRREANQARAKQLAQQFYDIADHNHGNKSVRKMSEFISQNLNKDNIVDFLDAYNDSSIRQKDSSIIDTIVSEIGASKDSRQNVLIQLLDVLTAAARDAGVDNDTIRRLRSDFIKSMTDEFNTTLKRVNPSVMENAINSLIGQIKAAKANIEDVSEEEAIESVAGSYQEQVEQAQETDDSREDNWIGRATDTVLGWFGCTTIEEMDEKLGACAADAKRLVDLAGKVQNGEDGAVESFKEAYKEIFGVEFNPKVIAARDEMQNNIAIVQFSEVFQEKISNVANVNSIEEVQQIANELGINLEDYLDLETATLQDYKDIMQELGNAYSNIAESILTEEGSIEQMQTSLEQLDQAAYGTQNPLKDAIKFNQNQQTTQMVAEIAGEIVLTVVITIATAGVGSVAAGGKLSATAAKWGIKGAKMLNRIKKLESVLAKVGKAQKIGKFAKATNKAQKVTNTAVKAGVSAAEAAAATAIMDTTYGKEAKEILERSLSMAVFAAGGVVAADLAPIIANAFKIGGKFATELAEDFLNMALATGVTYIENGTITDKDALINALTIFVMGRVGHIKGEKPNGTDIHTETPRVPECRQLGTEEEKLLLGASHETPHAHEGGNTKGSEAPHSEGSTSGSHVEGSEAPHSEGASNSNSSATENSKSTGAKKESVFDRIKARHQERVKAREARRAERKAAQEAEAKQKAEEKARVDAEKATKNNNIEEEYRLENDEFNPDELCRNAGNDGKPLNENYVKSSKDLREYYNRAIENGTYADSYENYVKMLEEGHKIAYGGFDGQHTWYKDVGEGGIDVNPGKIRADEGLHSDRVSAGKFVENLAKKYGDKYRTSRVSKVKLEGIPDEALPANIKITHYYPEPQHLHYYFEQMQRTAKEALELIKNKAPQDKILAKLAEHYQYAANARPFGQINNSLFMNELNSLLKKAGMKPMPHGMLDHAAQRLQPKAFKKYFIDEYKKTALSSNSSQQAAEAAARARAEAEAAEKAEATRLRNEAYAKFNKNQRSVELNGEGVLDQNVQYALQMDNLPEITLLDGTILNFKQGDLYNRIMNMKEGEIFTIGRAGETFGHNFANTVSGHHILVAKQNGRIIIKDISRNGRTRAKASANNQNHSYQKPKKTPEAQRKYDELLVTKKELERKVKSYKDEMNSLQLSSAELKKYKQILGISENEKMTIDSLKKAYRKKSMGCHSDQNPDKSNTEFQELQDAYKHLYNHLDPNDAKITIQKNIDQYTAELEKVKKQLEEIDRTGQMPTEE